MPVAPPPPIATTRLPDVNPYVPYGKDTRFPDIVYPTEAEIAIARQQALDDTARNASKTQLSCAARDALVPIVYGERIVGGLIVDVFTHDDSWVWWIVWCEGTVESVQEVQISGKALSDYAQHGLHLGTQTTRDSILYTALTETHPNGEYNSFNEVCTGLCYSVIKIPFGLLNTMPTFTAKVRGQKVWDPRISQRVWSRNPSLILADYITNTTWGAGLSVDWDSVATCADANDEMVPLAAPTEARRLCDIVIDREAFVSSWIETLRAAASCFVVNNAGTVKLIPDVYVSSPVASYSHTDGQIIELAEIALRYSELLPTVMEIQYTDTSKVPWETATIDPPVTRPNVGGSAPFRKSSVPMLWITRSSQARREAIERLNKLWMGNVTFLLHVFDEGVLHEPGDVISVTYPEAGFDALLMRVLNVTPTEVGWQLTLEQHVAEEYSDVVEVASTVPITTLPSPDAPPSVTSLAADEDPYQVQTGLWQSRIIARWPDMRASFPFVASYIVSITGQSPVLVSPQGEATIAQEQTYISGPLPEGNTVAVSVQVLSTTHALGALGDATASVLIGGKRWAPPSNVPTFWGSEVGGEVRLHWTPATGPADFDLTAHEIRWGAAAAAWNDCVVLERVAMPSTNYTTRAIPAGTWAFWIAARDSIRTAEYPYGQPSPNPTLITGGVIIVTLDVNAYIALDHALANPVLTHMSLLSDGRWITDYGHTWLATFGSISAMSTYTLPVAAYHESGTSSFRASYDFGYTVTGDWIADLSYSVLDSGVATTLIETSLNGSTWSGVAGTSIKSTARFVRATVSVTGGQGSGTLLVNNIGRAYVNVVNRREMSATPAMSLTAGGKLILLRNEYIAAKSAHIDPVFSSFALGVVDRLLVAPATGLMLTTQHDGGGECYTYQCIAVQIDRVVGGVGYYTIQAGDYLEYDLNVMPISADQAGPWMVGAMEVDLVVSLPNTGATNGRTLGIVDQYGHLIHGWSPEAPAGTWIHRKLSLAPAVGLLVARWNLVCESNTAGVHEAVYKNIRVTNGSGTVRATVWTFDAEGERVEPSYNATAYSVRATNIEAGPTNSFMAYVYDEDGFQIPDVPMNWTFEGV